MKNKPLKVAVIMDAITAINFEKDSTVAMLLAMQARHWQIYYLQPHQLFAKNNIVYGEVSALTMLPQQQPWYQLEMAATMEMQEFDVVLMRKDPPFNLEYYYTTLLLDLLATTGTLIVNHPQALRDANEKLFINCFPQCCPPTLVSKQAVQLKQFLAEQKEIVIKPLNYMAGTGVFHLHVDGANINATLELLTNNYTQTIMAQRFLPAVYQGDKRIILIDGVPIPYALLRVPAAGEIRANIATGGSVDGVPLTARDHWICQQLAPVLQAKGLLFVGIDVIGDYLTEINVTSTTGIRQLDKLFGLNIADQLLDCIVKKLGQ